MISLAQEETVTGFYSGHGSVKMLFGHQVKYRGNSVIDQSPTKLLLGFDKPTVTVRDCQCAFISG